MLFSVMRAIRSLRSGAVRASLVAIIGIVAVGCNVSGDLLADSFPDSGHVNAHVSDQNNAPVSGAVIDLLLATTTLSWRSATTDASGNASPGDVEGGILPGDYDARVSPPTGYTVASSQQNPVRITVQSNKTVNLNFKLTKAP